MFFTRNKLKLAETLGVGVCTNVNFSMFKIQNQQLKKSSSISVGTNYHGEHAHTNKF